VDSPSLKKYITEETLIKPYQQARLNSIAATEIDNTPDSFWWPTAECGFQVSYTALWPTRDQGFQSL